MRLSRFIRMGALAVFAAGMAMPAAAQPVRYELQEFEIDIEPVSREIERILARSTEPCGKLKEIEREIDTYLGFVDVSLEDEARTAITDRFGDRINALRGACLDANEGNVFRPYPDFGTIGVASDSTTFCSFRPGLIDTFTITLAPPERPDPPAEPPVPPEEGLPPETVTRLDDPLPGEGPCERARALLAELAELRRDHRFNLDDNIPAEIKDARNSLRRRAAEIEAELATLSGECPLKSSDPVPPETRDPAETPDFPVSPESPNPVRLEYPVVPVPRRPDPCEEARLVRERMEQIYNIAVRNATRGVPTEFEDKAAVAQYRQLEERLEQLMKKCPVETAPPAPERVSRDDPAPEPPADNPPSINTPVSIPVKATSAALDAGAQAQQIAGQVIVLLTPDQINPPLPQPGAERPQLGHDADRSSGVTDAEGRINIKVDLVDFFPDLPLDQLAKAGEGGFALVEVDTTARDGFIIVFDEDGLTRAKIERLDPKGFVDFSRFAAVPGSPQFGVANGPTDQIELFRRTIVQAVPGITIEDDLCMIKEPAAITDYNGCDFGEAGPPPGVRVLRPPAPHAELPGGALDPALTKEGETP